MLIKTKEKGIELLYRSMPYPDQIRNLDLTKNDAIYFGWRSSRYRLDLQFCSVMQSDGIMLKGDDCSILLERCLKNQLGTIL